MEDTVYLKEAKFENYKSIYETHIDIDDRIIVIAGKNESGKTNILKALKDAAEDNFNDDCKPLGFLQTNPTVKMTFEVLGSYLNELYKKNIFNSKEKYSFYIDRSMNEIDEVSGTMIDKIQEYLQREITKDVGDSINELVNLFNELDSNIDFDCNEGKKSIIEYITFYFMDHLFYNGDNEDTPFLGNMLSKIEDDNECEIDEDGLEKIINCIDDKLKKEKEVIELINSKGIIGNFIYFSSFDDMLPDEIDYLKLEDNEYCNRNKGFINLLNYLDISVDDFISEMQKNVRDVQNYLRNLSTKMTGNFSDIYTQETIELSLQKDGNNIVINIFDKNDKDYSKKPSQRSQGFQWFLAFYLVLNSKNCKKNTILLIDEPGLFLHAKAQEDILNYFETKIKNQIIYTTHSPFLVDINNMHRVKLAINDRNNTEGTKVLNKYYASNDYDTITPLITAIGYNIAKNPLDLGNGLNIITEGITDRYYLLAFLELLEVKNKNVHIIPSKGASQINYLVSMALGWNIDFRILVDNDKAGMDARKDLIKTILKYEDQERIVSVKEEKNATIESLFYEEDIDSTNLKENKTLIAFNFYQSVKEGKIKKGDLNIETINNFKKLFDKLGIE